MVDILVNFISALFNMRKKQIKFMREHIKIGDVEEKKIHVMNMNIFSHGLPFFPRTFNE